MAGQAIAGSCLLTGRGSQQGEEHAMTVCGRLTTHVLDTALGRPAQGVTLTVHAAESGDLLAKATTNADGRCEKPLLAGPELRAGRYDLRFDLAAYFALHHPGLPDPPFLEVVRINFGVADATVHYHVPLLVSPFGYSTYRGS